MAFDGVPALVGMESSGVTRRALRAIGIDAWSCDLLPAADGSKHHFQCNVFDIIGMGWKLAIFHPTCTYLTSAAEWAFKDPDFDRYPGVGYHQRLEEGTKFGAERRQARQEALADVMRCWGADIPHIAIENPVGGLSSLWRRPDQTIQPFNFGDDASKRTCLWLKNLPLLRPTGRAPSRLVSNLEAEQAGQQLGLFGTGVERWSNQTDSGQNKLSPSQDRWQERSETFPGVASAFSEQWGRYVLSLYS